MQQIQIPKELERSSEKIKKNFVGILNDGIIEYRGRPYILLNDADFALELIENRLFVFEIEVKKPKKQPLPEVRS